MQTSVELPELCTNSRLLTARFDLCFWCAETSLLSLQPTHLSVSAAGLVSSEHT